MAWSVASVDPFRANSNDPHFRIRILRVDGAIVAAKFYHPEHGLEPHPVEGCCEGTGAHPDSTVGSCVSIRRVKDAICWMPPIGSVLDVVSNPDLDLDPCLPLVRKSPLWFKSRDYERFLADAGLDPGDHVSKIRPFSRSECDQVLRHALGTLPDHPRRLPGWKDLSPLVLAREARPADSPFTAICKQAADARMNGATISEVIGEMQGMDLTLVDHLDLDGCPEVASLAFRIRGESVETWAPVGNGCWGRLEF